MARGIHRLTALQVAKAARQNKTVCDGGGLYLQRGSSWIFRYRRQGKPHHIGLGPLSLVELTEAREAALACRKQLFQGIDPLTSRASLRAAAALKAATAITFDACCAAYLAAHRDSWRSPKHRLQWENSLSTYASPVLGKLLVGSIDTPLVLRVLEPIWKTRRVTAGRLRGRIEKVLGWAAVRGYRDNSIPNPARWKDNLDHLLAAKSAVSEVKHLAALPYAELPAFMPVLRKQTGTAARALELTILTAVRTGDVIGMKWSHVDFYKRQWVIPKTKNGTTHRVPLSGPALTVLDQVKPFIPEDLVFRGDRKGQPLSTGAMLAVLHRMGRRDLTVHGFRSCFKTFCAEQTSVPHEVIEAALTHTISAALERAYRRGDFYDKRARLMQHWADFCGGAAPQVVALHG